ncbi:MAG: hypothetical protein ACKER6_00170 [Candidatus Hodgkinia cicadicola]
MAHFRKWICSDLNVGPPTTEASTAVWDPKLPLFPTCEMDWRSLSLACDRRKRNMTMQIGSRALLRPAVRWNVCDGQ